MQRDNETVHGQEGLSVSSSISFDASAPQYLSSWLWYVYYALPMWPNPEDRLIQVSLGGRGRKQLLMQSKGSRITAMSAYAYYTSQREQGIEMEMTVQVPKSRAKALYDNKRTNE